ncbi:MAG TPA: TIGR00296 family protein [Thermoplasmatales archaeon]|nr:TIGR00296 family protein [Thermoplasmatales archaeon]HEX08748.1 TIGR00296 family protein [Thermoplasmatales archaeon]
MLTKKEGEEAVRLAREIIERYIKKEKLPNIESYSGIFDKKRGVFVTINTYPDHNLRGCIGIPEPIMPLKNAIMEAAISATHDPRFPSLKENELDNIVIEVTILTKPELVKVDKPQEYIEKIKIGRDGLIAEQGFYRGLLLPQVPVEQGWDVEEFLSHTCWKAGLPFDAWFDESTKIYKFEGQIFTEIKPRDGIVEKNIR